MHRRHFLTGAAGILAAGASGRASAAPLPNTPEAYGIVFKDVVAQQKFDTAILVVRRKGKTVAVHGHNTRANGPTLIGSMSKPITAVAVATLIQAGKLKFTTPMKVALAGHFKHYGPPSDRRFEAVTVEQLLVHRSGMRGNEDGDPSHALIADRAQSGKGHLDVPQEILAALLKGPLVRDPGSGKPFYSNGGYFALAAVIEQISGKPYEKYCVEAVFGKLGLQAQLHPQWRVLGAPGGWFISGDNYLRFLDVFDPNNPFLTAAVKRWIDEARDKWTPAENPWRSLAVATSMSSGRWRVEHGGGLNSQGKDASGKPTTAAIESYGLRKADGTSVFTAITPAVEGGHPGFQVLSAEIEKTHAQVTKF